MNEIHWRHVVQLHPLQWADPRSALDSYVKGLLNKYHTELSGILLRVNNSSLRLLPALDLARAQDTTYSCCIRLHPEQPLAKVQVQMEATVFRPRSGLILDSLVTVAKPQRLVCRHGEDFAVYVGVPLQSTDDVAQPLPPDIQRLFPQDRVHVEVVRVLISAAGDAINLTGRIVALVERGKIGKKSLALVSEVDLQDATPVPKKGKRSKSKRLHSEGKNVDVEKFPKHKSHKKHLLHQDDESEGRLIKQELEPPAEENRPRKKIKSRDVEDERMHPTKKNKSDRKSRNIDAGVVTVKREAREASPDIFSDSEDDQDPSNPRPLRSNPIFTKKEAK